MVHTYRFKAPIMVVVQHANRPRLVQLPAGSIFQTNDSTPDVNRMVDGTCNSDGVMMFARDLEERAEFIEEKVLRASA